MARQFPPHRPLLQPPASREAFAFSPPPAHPFICERFEAGQSPQTRKKVKPRIEKIMTIETKYNIGDEVWFHTSSGPICGTINGITVTKYGLIAELLSEDLAYITWPLSKCFPTKEELLKSL